MTCRWEAFGGTGALRFNPVKENVLHVPGRLTLPAFNEEERQNFPLKERCSPPPLHVEKFAYILLFSNGTTEIPSSYIVLSSF